MNITREKNKSNIKFDQLISNIQSKLFGFIFSLIPHREDAEDVLQKTNLILIQKQSEFDPEKGNFKTWSFSIARYQAMAELTRKKRSRISLSNETLELVAAEASTDEFLHIKTKALHNCYSKLPDHMKTIADLRFSKSLPIKQICQHVSRPQGSVTATLYRIRERLTQCIHREYELTEEEHFKTYNHDTNRRC